MGFGRLHQMQDAKGVPFRSSQTGGFPIACQAEPATARRSALAFRGEDELPGLRWKPGHRQACGLASTRPVDAKRRGIPDS